MSTAAQSSSGFCWRKKTYNPIIPIVWKTYYSRQRRNLICFWNHLAESYVGPLGGEKCDLQFHHCVIEWTLNPNLILDRLEYKWRLCVVTWQPKLWSKVENPFLKVDHLLFWEVGRLLILGKAKAFFSQTFHLAVGFFLAKKRLSPQNRREIRSVFAHAWSFLPFFSVAMLLGGAGKKWKWGTLRRVATSNASTGVDQSWVSLLGAKITPKWKFISFPCQIDCPKRAKPRHEKLPLHGWSCCC